MPKKPNPEYDEWKKIWDARLAALIPILGKDSDYVDTAVPPFYMGGFADVMEFPSYVPGMTYVTGELTGPGTCQIPNSLGQYELMVCVKEKNPRAADMVSRLSRYTCDAKVKPHDVMDLKNFFHDDTIRGLVFANPQEPPPSFEVLGQKCGLLLCIGITQNELDFADAEGSAKLLDLLKKNKIFPYTIPNRPSVPF
jgi:hypothetical protein